MHTGTLDVVQAGDSPRQFTFQATTITRGFHELAGTETLLLVENFETDVAVTRGHTGTRQFQLRTPIILRLDQQSPGVRLDGIGNVSGRQGLDNLIGVHPRQAAEQRPIIRLLRPKHHGEANRHTGGQTDQQANLAQHRHIREIFQKRQTQQGLLRLCRRGGGHICSDCFSHDSIPLC